MAIRMILSSKNLYATNINIFHRWQKHFIENILIFEIPGGFFGQETGFYPSHGIMAIISRKLPIMQARHNAAPATTKTLKK